MCQTAGRDVHLQRTVPGRLKSNIDASFSQSTNRVDIGIFVRDDDGDFVLAKFMSSSLYVLFMLVKF